MGCMETENVCINEAANYKNFRMEEIYRVPSGFRLGIRRLSGLCTAEKGSRKKTVAAQHTENVVNFVFIFGLSITQFIFYKL